MVRRLFIWTGGALFMVSLAVCGWTFVVSWGRTGHLPVSAPAVFLDTLLFTIFAAHHSLFARPAVKARLARALPEAALRSVYVWIASLLLVLVCAAWRPVGGDLYDQRGLLALVHTAFQLAGVAIIALAARVIDPLELAGLRRGGGTAIEIAGPYRWVRHPIYLGWVLATFGTPHMTGDRLLFAVVSSAYLVAAMPWEERALARAAGDAYRRYRERVRWRLIPGVY